MVFEVGLTVDAKLNRSSLNLPFGYSRTVILIFLVRSVSLDLTARTSELNNAKQVLGRTL